ncbi:YlbE-like family protein [Thalassorhabdus alkalitolerans]|uniref:YlbE-like family protein n=1 Tax=Thalassorhabdus alkalitolerans TaxID=2282697 RepID=A0ABW0YIV8_9BACI|nr:MULTISPECIES: YlbE-like family protein [Bacillaceae]
MRQDVYSYVSSRPDLKAFIRFHPHWYRRLNRNPQRIMEFEKEANIYHGKTFPQRVEKMNHGLNMVMMLLNMLRAQ